VTRVAVVGGGPAGLAAAYRLTAAGVPTVVFEAGSSIGGLARSMEIWGQAVDLGAHMFTLKDPLIGRLWTELVGSDYDAVPRSTRVLFDRWALSYPYDLLEVVRKLGVAEAARCVASLGVAQLRRPEAEVDLETWVVRRFGKRPFELFFAGYIKKLFGAPAHQIDGAFAETLLGFQQHGSLAQAVWSRCRPRRSNTTPTMVVRPHGGIGVLTQRLADYVCDRGGDVRCDAPIARLATAGERITGLELRSGESWEIDFVVSSLPLALTARLVGRDPLGRQEAPRFRSVVLVYLRVAAEAAFRDQWVFLASARFKSSRVTNFRSWSPPDGDDVETVLSVEFWCDGADSLWSAADEDLQELAVDELVDSGLVRRQSVLDGHVVRLPNAFPVPVAGYADALAATGKELARYRNLTTTAGAASNVGVHGSLIAGMEAGDTVARASVGGATSDLAERALS
jgi:protoporphyrinogen oxidase